MIIRNLFEGGIYFMLPIYIMWLVVFIQVIRFILQYRSNAELEPSKLKKTNETILFIGSFAFLFGILGQIIGLLGAFDSIQRAGDVSPALLAGGLKVSFFAPVYGFVLFLISGIVWFVFRNLLSKS